jgi:hypothetical protein
LGKVVIVFAQGWSHDADWPTTAYRASIYEEDNLQLLNNCIQYLKEPTSLREETSFKDYPKDYYLLQNYPNPFNPSTIIRFELPTDADVVLIVYDVIGNEIARLVNDRRKAGIYEVKFEASNLSNGIYLYKLQAGEFVQVHKMILLK